MGAGPSRKVELQDGPGGVTVTEDVLNHLIEDSRVSDREGNKISFRDANQVRRAMQELHQEREQMNDALMQAHATGVEQGAEQMRRAKDHELRQLDVAWQDRMDIVNREREETTTAQFNQTLDEFGARFRLRQRPVECTGAQASVLDCYKANPGRSLNCSDQVRAFARCVETARFNYLSNGPGKPSSSAATAIRGGGGTIENAGKTAAISTPTERPAVAAE